MISWKSMAKEKLPIPLFDPLRYLLFKILKRRVLQEQTEGTEELRATILPFIYRWDSVAKEKFFDPSI